MPHCHFTVCSVHHWSPFCNHNAPLFLHITTMPVTILHCNTTMFQSYFSSPLPHRNASQSHHNAQVPSQWYSPVTIANYNQTVPGIAWQCPTVLSQLVPFPLQCLHYISSQCSYLLSQCALSQHSVHLCNYSWPLSHNSVLISNHNAPGSYYKAPQFHHFAWYS